jgi:hypothetical protein
MLAVSPNVCGGDRSGSPHSSGDQHRRMGPFQDEEETKRANYSHYPVYALLA